MLIHSCILLVVLLFTSSMYSPCHSYIIVGHRSLGFRNLKALGLEASLCSASTQGLKKIHWPMCLTRLDRARAYKISITSEA